MKADIRTGQMSHYTVEIDSIEFQQNAYLTLRSGQVNQAFIDSMKHDSDVCITDAFILLPTKYLIRAY